MESRTNVDMVNRLDKKLKNIKVVMSLISSRLNQEGSREVSFSREDLQNILSVVEQFIDDYEQITERFRSEARVQTRLTSTEKTA